MIANLNDMVRVKLTEKGLVEYVLEHERMPLLDKEGYYESQLWTFMAVFGKHMFMGGSPLFEGNNLEILK